MSYTENSEKQRCKLAEDDFSVIQKYQKIVLDKNVEALGEVFTDDVEMYIIGKAPTTGKTGN